MDIWQIVVIVVLAALILVWVAVIAYNKGRVSGRLAAEQDLSGDEDTHSLFGDDAPVRPTERRLIEVLPEALIVTDRNGLVQYSSPGSVPFGLVSGDRLNSREVEDILTQAAADGGMREREVQLPINPIRPLMAEDWRPASHARPTRCICVCALAISAMTCTPSSSTTCPSSAVSRPSAVTL